LNVLMSYFFMKGRPPVRPPWVRRLFIDSGAFSAQSSGKPVRLSEYIKWIQDNRQSLDLYAALDVIGDPVKTRRNLEIMRAEGLAPVPVFHLGSPLEELTRLVEERPPLIAIGGLVGHLRRSNRREIVPQLNSIFERASGVPLHGFGVGRSFGFQFPWRSCDASVVGVSTHYGHVYYYSRTDKAVREFATKQAGPGLRYQMKIAHSMGLRRTDLLGLSAESRAARVRAAIDAMSSFESHVNESRTFDFYYALHADPKSRDIEFVDKAINRGNKI
jgi:hypothetical protein